VLFLTLVFLSLTNWRRLWPVGIVGLGIVGLVVIYSTVATYLKPGPLTPSEKIELPANEKETYVIFLSGLDSYCDGTPYNQMGFEYIRNQFNRLGLTYDDEHFLMYSYTGGKVEAGRWYPNPYNSVDTGQPIQFGVKEL
jgi:hypothetical protein